MGRNQTILFFKRASEPRDKKTIELHAFIFPSPNPLPLERALQIQLICICIDSKNIKK
jgi:hypothetical protein